MFINISYIVQVLQSNYKIHLSQSGNYINILSEIIKTVTQSFPQQQLQQFPHMQTSHCQDQLHLSQQPNIISQLQPKEQIQLSTLIKKINDDKIAQERIFLLTTQAIYNISKRSGIIKSLVSKLISMQSRFCIKRKIPLSRLYGITLSRYRQNAEFIIHVIDDYDYSYCAESHQQKVLLLKKICGVYSSFNGNKKLPFYFKEEIVLFDYVTNKQDLKSKIDRKPKENAVFLGEEDFQQFQLPDLNYKLQYSSNDDNKNVTMKQFTTVFQIQKLSNQHQQYTITTSTMELKQIQQLLKIELPFLLKPQFIFSTKSKLQLLTPFIIGGNLSRKLKQSVRISEQLAYFYIAELIVMLQQLEEKNISYGNFCLENIFIAQNGYLRLQAIQKDLSIKDKSNLDSLNYNIVGYSHYLPPQMILVKGNYPKQVNMWKLGVCAHYLLLGSYPFTGATSKKVYNQILTKKLVPQTPQILLRLLEKNPNERISLEQIKSHPKLTHIDWLNLKDQAIPAPFLPDTSSWKGNLPSILQFRKSQIQGTILRSV